MVAKGLGIPVQTGIGVGVGAVGILVCLGFVVFFLQRQNAGEKKQFAPNTESQELSLGPMWGRGYEQRDELGEALPRLRAELAGR